MTFVAGDPLARQWGRVGAYQRLALYGADTGPALRGFLASFQTYADPRAALKARMLWLALRSAAVRRAARMARGGGAGGERVPVACAWCAAERGAPIPIRLPSSTICRRHRAAVVAPARNRFRVLYGLGLGGNGDGGESGPRPAA